MKSPPNGFQFVDAAISHESLQTWDFESLCQQVQARRAANPRFNLTTDLDAIRAEVDLQNAMRVLAIPRAEGYVITDGSGGPPPNRLAPPMLRRAALAGEGVKRVASGVGVLKDWLGDGAVPVENEKAIARAGKCVGCPQNAQGDWTSWFTEPVANVVRHQLSIRKDLNLSTPHDAALNVCDACGCPLKLKVHVPLNHIKAHLGDEVKPKLDPRCWILAELAQQQ